MIFCLSIRVYEDGQWGLVYETPHIDNNLNPKFPTLRIPMLVLCNGDYDRPVKIEIWDHESSGKHQFMGQVETSVRGIINSEGHALDVIEPLKREKKKNYVNSGTLTCNNPYVEKNPSFVDVGVFIHLLTFSCIIILLFVFDMVCSIFWVDVKSHW